MRPEIDSYLREHGGRYTREALRERLVAAGHPADEVDAALDEWSSRRTAQDAADRELRGRYWRWTWGIFGAVWLGTVVVAGGSAMGAVALILGIAMLVGLAVSGAIGRYMVRSTGLGVALIVPVVAALLIGGSCIGLMGGVSNL
jgi:hypothetical protein